jgi:methyltransferase-like protein/SAM-dependent methyltransferase
MSEVQATSYDEVPYGNTVFYYTHPDRLAALALLLGMEARAVDRCRVLELGCGTGSNLIPMAQDLPGSRFVGIDLSTRQIAMGQEVVEALGLSNIQLKALSILEVDKSFGEFDYILCHGVYSWVPAEVRDKILDICVQNLAPQGVAYVSYNTYPGWHMRGMIREIMGFHARRFADPRERVRQARALLDFLAKVVGDRETIYGGLLRIEADMLQSASDAYLYHEHLEDVNHPVYFYQFMEQAAAKGLQYIGEARQSLLASRLSPEVTATLEALAVDLIHAEQYLDFVRNRTFRRSLLCHDTVTLQRPPLAARLTSMHVTGHAKPVADRPDLLSSTVEEFRTSDGTELTTNNPLAKVTLASLFEAWPRPVPFESLWRTVHSRLAQAPEPDSALLERSRELLADTLLQCYLSTVVDLHVVAPQFVVEISECPVASPLARLQAETEEKVTNRRHRAELLSAVDRLVLRHLDGKHNRAALMEVLVQSVARGDLEIQQNGQALREGANIPRILEEGLATSLHRLAAGALLVG